MSGSNGGKVARPGMVYWITGLPRSGKTTLGRALAAALRARGVSVVELDGDAVRAALGGDLGYSQSDRVANARRISGLCKLFSLQNLIVVCSTVSLFREIHNLNRATLPNYLEVLLAASPDLLRARDPHLYDAAHRGDALLPGVNQTYELPMAPDLVIGSIDGDAALEEAVARLLAAKL